ncbi:MAG: GNAT family N-acetyltransferase [Rhodospirillales bacterium]|nr:GNAT family N-acetyltransferase [Rhodospirillales bacterium]
MIRPVRIDEQDQVVTIVNDAAHAYKGVIPADRWHEPYMPLHELRHEISGGVFFWGWEEDGALQGVMGLQAVKDVHLIRHAYVRSSQRRAGIGSRLLSFLMERVESPLLIGTWAAADWAIRFYEKHGFELTTAGEKERLLRTYWSIPERQIETSVVLKKGL